MTTEIQPTRFKILIQPEASSASSFSTDSKKYDRRSIAVIKSIGSDLSELDICKDIKVGDRIVYDDSNSIDFNLNGVLLSLIDPEDIAARIKEI